MLRSRSLVALATCLLTTVALADVGSAPRRGRFRLATYNVAGLPEGLSQVHPLQSLPVVGKRLNAYDLALVQEDFAYPRPAPDLT